MVIIFNFETLNDCPLRDIVIYFKYIIYNAFVIVHGQLYHVRNNCVSYLFALKTKHDNGDMIVC